MHVMSQEKFFFPKKIEKLISKCDVLCMEVANISNQSIEPNLLFDMDKSIKEFCTCLLYTSPSPRDRTRSRMPSSA